MTREEIIEAIQNDNMMPFLQDWEARDIVDFVLKNIQPSLPDGLEEEIERQLDVFPYTKVTPELPESRLILIQKQLRLFARHFAEWGVEHTKQKPELVQHPAISYMYNADAGRGEQIKQAILALLKSDLIQVAGRGFTKTELIDWVETRPAKIKEDEK